MASVLRAGSVSQRTGWTRRTLTVTRATLLVLFSGLLFSCAQGSDLESITSLEPAADVTVADKPLFALVDDIDERIGRLDALQTSGDPGVLRSRFTQVNESVLAKSDLIELNLFEGQEFSAVVDRRYQTVLGAEVTLAQVPGTPFGYAILTVYEGAISGMIGIPTLGLQYSIADLGEGVQAIRQVDPRMAPICGNLPDAEQYAGQTATVDDLDYARLGDLFGAVEIPDDGSLSLTLASRSRTKSAPANPNGNPNIDVMFVYTPEALAGAGSEAAMIADIETAVAYTNLCYANSLVDQRIRVVHVYGSPESEISQSASPMLTAVRDAADGYLDEVHGLRDKFGADLVCLVFQGANTLIGGEAYLMSDISPAFEAYGFSVVKKRTITNYVTIAHELGHNMGGNHQTAGCAGPGAYYYSHAYGFKNLHEPLGGRGLRTVMYSTAYDFSTEIPVPHFSNPSVTYTYRGNTEATGAYDSAVPDNSSDNALSINNAAATVAAFRDTAYVIADAGADLGAIDSDGNGTEMVGLDGSASYPMFAGVNITSYQWHEAGVLLATGAAPMVSFNVGVHTVVLTVADASGYTDTDTLTVEVGTVSELRSVVISPSVVTGLIPGESVQLTAQGFDLAGNSYPLGLVTWSTTGGPLSTTGGSVDANGLYTAPPPAEQGTYTVTATTGGVAGTTMVIFHVPPRLLTTVEITPDYVELQPGDTADLVAQGYDQWGYPYNKRVASDLNTKNTWNYDPPSVWYWRSYFTGGSLEFDTHPITSDLTCRVTAGDDPGTYDLIARNNTAPIVSGQAVIVVAGGSPLTYIDLSPLGYSLNVGESLQYTANGYDTHHRLMDTPPSVTWVASGGSITSTGLYTAPSIPGTFTVQAANGGIEGRTSVYVTAAPPELTSLTMNIDSLPLMPGTMFQFSAKTLDQYGNLISAPLSWTALNGTVDASGLYTASTTPGTDTLTVSAGTIQTTATIRIQDPNNIIRMDTNGDGSGPDIADLTYLINHLFSGGPPAATIAQADYNLDGQVDIGDLTGLIGFLFAGGPPPQ